MGTSRPTAMPHERCARQRDTSVEHGEGCGEEARRREELDLLPEALREVADYRMLVYAIVLILVMQATNNPTMKRFFGSVREKLTPKRKERAAL